MRPVPFSPLLSSFFELIHASPFCKQMVHDIYVWLSKEFVGESHRFGHLGVELTEGHFAIFHNGFGLIRVERRRLDSKSLVAPWMLHSFVAWWWTFDWALEVISTLVLGLFVKPPELDK